MRASRARALASAVKRWRAIGGLYRRNRAEAVAQMVEAIETHEGNLQRAADFLGLGFRQLYRYLWRENLWPVVDRVRLEAKLKEEADRGRRDAGETVRNVPGDERG